MNHFDKNGVFCAAIAIFLYVLHEFIPVFFIQIIAAFFMVVALCFLFVSARISWEYTIAYKRHKNFEKLKKQLTENYNGKPDSRRKDEEGSDKTDS
jgi:hypothetical protein